jgi:hypothetical protein
MEKEIVYTEEYALILSDEEITEQTGNDTIFNKNLNAIIAGVYDDDDNQFKVLAHLPLSDAPILEGVPLLPSFSWNIQDDVEKIAPTHFECEMMQLSSNESFGLDYGSSNLKPKTITNPQGQVELVGKYLNL